MGCPAESAMHSCWSGQTICSLQPATTLVEPDIVIVLVLNAKVAFVVLASACKLLKCWLVFLLIMLVLTATEVLVLQLTLTPKFNQPSIIIHWSSAQKQQRSYHWHHYYYLSTTTTTQRGQSLYGDQGDIERSQKVSTTHLVQVYLSLTQAANADEP